MDVVDLMDGLTSDEVDQIAAYAKEIQLPFALTHLPFSVFNPKKIVRAIDITKQLESQCTVIHPPVALHKLEEYNEQAEYDMVMTQLAPLVDYANRVGVQLSLENMNCYHKNFPYPVRRFCSDPETLCKTADALGIGVCWDTGHANISELKQSEALEYVGSRLKMVHINDNFGKDDLHVAPFVGTVDWQDTMQGFRKTGFDGYFNFEVSTKYMSDEMCEPFGKFLITVAEKLTNMI